MNERLVEAFWHAKHRLYGRRLRPLTLRHCFVLASAGNPLIEGGAIPTTADLIQAVEICSRPPSFFLEGNQPNWLARQWVGFLSVLEKQALPKFVAYLNDYSTGPRIWQKAGGNSSPKVHWTVSTVAGLCHWCGLSLAEAWAMTPGEAQWLLAAAIDQSPMASIDVMTDAEIAVAEMLEGGAA